LNDYQGRGASFGRTIFECGTLEKLAQRTDMARPLRHGCQALQAARTGYSKVVVVMAGTPQSQILNPCDVAGWGQCGAEAMRGFFDGVPLRAAMLGQTGAKATPHWQCRF